MNRYMACIVVSLIVLFAILTTSIVGLFVYTDSPTMEKWECIANVDDNAINCIFTGANVDGTIAMDAITLPYRFDDEYQLFWIIDRDDMYYGARSLNMIIDHLQVILPRPNPNYTK